MDARDERHLRGHVADDFYGLDEPEDEPVNAALVSAIAAANDWLKAQGFAEINEEQRDALDSVETDAAIAEDVRGMLDDWNARLGMPEEISEPLWIAAYDVDA